MPHPSHHPSHPKPPAHPEHKRPIAKGDDAREGVHFITPYRKLLDEIAKDYDLFPFIELLLSQANSPGVTGQFAMLPFQGAVGTSATQLGISDVPSYGLVWDEMPFLAWDISYPTTDPLTDGVLADLSSSAFTVQWSTGAIQQQVAQSLQQISTDSAFGTPADQWLKQPGGVRLKNTAPKSWEQLLEQLTLVQLPSGGANLAGVGFVIPAVRGYKFYEKGSLWVPQKTREEYLAEGFELEPFTYDGQVTVLFVPGTGVPNAMGSNYSYLNIPGPLSSYQITFNSPKAKNAPFLCNRIRVRPMTIPYPGFPFIDCVGVGLQTTGAPAINLQNAVNGTLPPWRMFLGADYSTSGLVGGLVGAPPFMQQLRTQWELPRPITIPYNTKWNFLAQALVSLYPGQPLQQQTMEFVLEGELILPKG